MMSYSEFHFKSPILHPSNPLSSGACDSTANTLKSILWNTYENEQQFDIQHHINVGRFGFSNL